MRYHINIKGDAKPCSATQKPCPYGSITAHFPSETAGRAYFEGVQERLEFELSATLKPLMEAIANATYKNQAWYFSNGQLMDVTMFKILSSAVGRVLEAPVIEEDLLACSRRLLVGKQLKDLFGSDFMEEHFRALVEEVRTSDTRRSYKIPKSTPVIVGDRATAKALQTALDTWADPNILELGMSTRGRAILEASGFSMIGYGAEQVAFIHEPSQTVWKVAQWADDGKDNTVNTLMGVEAFPMSDKLRHAHTTAYGNVVAQEYLPTPPQRKPTKEEAFALALTGHSDWGDNNFASDASGMLVAFDTVGTVFEDLGQCKLG